MKDRFDNPSHHERTLLLRRRRRIKRKEDEDDDNDDENGACKCDDNANGKSNFSVIIMMIVRIAVFMVF